MNKRKIKKKTRKKKRKKHFDQKHVKMKSSCTF